MLRSIDNVLSYPAMLSLRSQLYSFVHPRHQCVSPFTAQCVGLSDKSIYIYTLQLHYFPYPSPILQTLRKNQSEIKDPLPCPSTNFINPAVVLATTSASVVRATSSKELPAQSTSAIELQACNIEQDQSSLANHRSFLQSTITTTTTMPILRNTHTIMVLTSSASRQSNRS